jgi:transcriptional regulator
MHGYGIALHIRDASDNVLQVGEGSLYPALQRLLENGWVDAEWGLSENNRKACYYHVTLAGRKHLAQLGDSFETMIAAIGRAMA